MLKVGEPAPDFEALDQNGRKISLSFFIDRYVVLYFYPKDFSYGCTIETKEFSSIYNEIKDFAEIIGVSSDDTETHKEFASECNAEFHLVSDKDGSIRKMYDVKPSLGIIPGRVTYVIDKEGKIAFAISSQISPRKHAKEAKRIIYELIDKENRAKELHHLQQM